MTPYRLMTMVRWFALLTILVLSTTTFVQTAFAQTDTGDFVREFTTLSEKLKIPFIVEEGLFPARCNTEVPASKSQTIKTLAARWDLEAEPRSGVVLFRKRYSRNEDIPFIGLAEWRAAMKDTSELLENFIPPVTETPLKTLVQKITPQQQEPLKTGVLVSQLTQVQQGFLWRYLLREYGMGAAGITKTNLMLADEFLAKERYFVRGIDEYTSLASRLPKQGTYVHVYYDYKVKLRASLPPGEGEVKLSEITFPETGLVRVSLERAAEQWSGKVNLNSEIKHSLSSMFGANLLTPETFASGIARLYGYRIREEKKGVWQLARQRVSRVTELNQLPNTLRLYLPMSLRRYLYLDRMPQTANFTAYSEWRGRSDTPDSLSSKTIFEGLTTAVGIEIFRDCVKRRCNLLGLFSTNLMNECLTVKEAKKAVSPLAEEGITTAVFIPEGLLGVETFLLNEPLPYIAQFAAGSIQVILGEVKGVYEVRITHSAPSVGGGVSTTTISTIVSPSPP